MKKEECKRICSVIWWKFGTDKNELEEELARSLSRVLCVKIKIEHMTGKLVNESYQVLTLFFIPVWRWNKTYFAETTCCHKQFILDKSVGDLLRNGEDVEIVDSDLNEIY